MKLVLNVCRMSSGAAATLGCVAAPYRLGEAYKLRSQPADGAIEASLLLEVKVFICDELQQKYRRRWASFWREPMMKTNSSLFPS